MSIETGTNALGRRGGITTRATGVALSANLEHNGDLYIDYRELDAIVHKNDVPGSSTLREQGAIVHDPNDPNLGSNPEREYKFYFSTDGKAIWVSFSATGSSPWSDPVNCGFARASEDPSVVELWDQPGVVHRDGSNKLHMYVEDDVSHDIYVYDSTDGLTWTSMSGNPVVSKVSTSWEGFLVGSPNAKWDGTRYLLGYEGIADAGSPDAFGLAHGTTANSLTKLAANPLWHPSDEPDIGVSIVVDAFYLAADEQSIVFVCHDGQSATYKAFRGRTTVTNPLDWVRGDIELVGSTDFGGTSADVTGDGASIGGISRVVTQEARGGGVVMFTAGLSLTVPNVVASTESVDDLAWEWRFESDQIVGLSDNDDVTTWPDLSGNSRPATFASGQRPVYKTAVANGEPALRYTAGTEQRGTVAAITALVQPTTIVLVANIPSQSVVTAFDGLSGSSRHLFGDAGGVNTWLMFAGKGTAGVLARGFLAVYVLVFNTRGSMHFADGGRPTFASVGDHSLTGLTIGNQHTSGTSAFGGDMFAIGAINQRLTLGQIDLVGSHYASKYGTTWTPVEPF